MLSMTPSLLMSYFSVNLSMLLIMNPVAVGIYSLVTFVPKWFTDDEIARNRNSVVILVVVWVVVSILNYATNVNLA